MSDKKVYRISTGWGIVIFIFAVGMIALSSWLIFSEGFKGNITQIIIIWSLSLFLCAACTMGLLEIFRTRVEVYSDKIILIGTFKTQELLISEIDGFTIPSSNSEYIYLVPKNKSKKKLSISKYLGNFKELAGWIDENIKNIDAEILRKEIDEIYSNPELGQSEEQKTHTFQKYRIWANRLSIVASISALYLIFYGKPLVYVVAINLLIPVIALIFVIKSNGIVKLDGNEKSAYPEVAVPLLLPSIVVGAEALGYNYLNPIAVLQPTLIAISLLSIVVLQFVPSNMRKSGPLLYLFIIIVLYSSAAIPTANCVFSKNPATVEQVQIISKRNTTDRSPDYYLTVRNQSVWNKDTEIEVRKDVYENSKIGDKACMHIYNGLIGIKWFKTRLCT